AQALTKEAFRPFGDVLETEGVEAESINFGNTRKFAELAQVTIADNANAQLCIYRSKAIAVPFRIQLMECHPLGSQAFYPLHQNPFPVVVAKAGGKPGPADIRAFLTNGRQGVNLHAGVWHHYQLTLDQDSDYLVIDRRGTDDNYLEHPLSDEVWLEI
ncbi:MAG: ureidoglycolate lyase, partial [Xanthomonadales bacterium]|nr:ureidoglycolate lyase [Xanthomonadales bacterium]